VRKSIRWNLPASSFVSDLLDSRNSSARRVVSFLDEFVNEYQDYDQHNRTVQFRTPESLLDDTVHATNYAQIIGAEIRNSLFGKMP
jgi:hypothetical protein